MAVAKLEHQPNRAFEAWMDGRHPNWRGYQKTATGKENNIVAQMRAAWEAGYREAVVRALDIKENMDRAAAKGRK